jgi:hypothetical protein
MVCGSCHAMHPWLSRARDCTLRFTTCLIRVRADSVRSYRIILSDFLAKGQRRTTIIQCFEGRVNFPRPFLFLHDKFFRHLPFDTPSKFLIRGETNPAANRAALLLHRYYLEQFSKYAISDECPTGCLRSLVRIVEASARSRRRRADTASSVFRVTSRFL